MQHNTAIVDFEYGSTDTGYTGVQVLKSAAGYYIGTLFINGQTSECPGLVEPGSRDSGYYATEHEATLALHEGSYCRF